MVFTFYVRIDFLFFLIFRFGDFFHILYTLVFPIFSGLFCYISFNQIFLCSFLLFKMPKLIFLHFSQKCIFYHKTASFHLENVRFIHYNDD
jgi:hypothetical protein